MKSSNGKPFNLMETYEFAKDNVSHLNYQI